jgi:hypothetical protein
MVWVTVSIVLVITEDPPDPWFFAGMDDCAPCWPAEFVARAPPEDHVAVFLAASSSRS